MLPLLAVFFEKAEEVPDAGPGTQTVTFVRREDPDTDVLANECALDTQTVTKIRHEDPDQDVTGEQPGTDPKEAGTQTGTRAREEPDTDIFDRDSSYMWEAALL